jgi:hypothetical protein
MAVSPLAMTVSARAADPVDTAPERPQYLQVVNPADKQREAQESAEDRRVGEPTTQAVQGPVHQPRASFELPAVEVVGERESSLREEERVGPYAQPRWTARRRFPSTRVYVRPPGTAELEYWLRPTVTKDGDTEIRTLYELSVGFEPRLQLDLYFRTDQEGDDSEMLIGHQVELRYALADWGKIWGNPTLYVEWAGLEQRPDVFEAKLLLGGELAERWHWGANLVGEFQTGGEREYEYQLTGGASYAVADSKLALGAEAQFIISDVKDDPRRLRHADRIPRAECTIQAERPAEHDVRPAGRADRRIARLPGVSRGRV